MTEAEMKGSQKSPQYLKDFMRSALAGAIFGLVFSLIFIIFLSTPWPPALFAAGVTLLTGLLSGLAGLGAAYLDGRLLSWGVQKGQLRTVITFGIVVLITFALTFAVPLYFGVITLDAGIQRYLMWGGLSGLAFGAVYAIITYRSDKVRQKMLLLEMQNRHLAELAYREELLREAARNLAVAEERNRMARELHDSISQGMHGIVYSLRSLRGVLKGNQPGLEILGHLEETAAGTLKELRHLVVELTPSPLEEHGLPEALRLHCDLFSRRQAVELILELNYNGGLLPDQEAALYRIVQEALANIQQHADADRVEISLQEVNKIVQLSIVDNGKGFAPAAVARGHGLANISTRVRRNDGTLQIVSSPGEGAAITAVFQKPTVR